MPGVIPDLQDTDPDKQQAIDEQAEMILRAKNIKEFKSVLTLAGTLVWPNGIAIESGINVTFKNKGIFDGKWIIQKETLHISENKFITEVEFRKCIVPKAGTTIKTVPLPQDLSGPDPDPESGDPNNPTP
jgi:hypothetical protein